jgi:hypothetical protein
MKTTRLLCFAAPILLSACSSVSVKDLKQTGVVTKPAHIYVAPFDTTRGTFKIAGDPTGAKSPAFRQNVATVLADYTVQNVTKHVAPASKVSPGAAPRSGWIVTGRFVRVNTGSRGLRVLVGLGAGGTKMETEVEVFDAASGGKTPFLHFSTTGGSNAMPGLLSSTGPGSAAFSMLSQATTGVTDDAARTSRMITGALSEYFGARGWIPKDKIFQTKKLGDYQMIHGM